MTEHKKTATVCETAAVGPFCKGSRKKYHFNSSRWGAENQVCVCCNRQIEEGDIIHFGNGDDVCRDCLEEYLAEEDSGLYEDFARSQDYLAAAGEDFFHWWFREEPGETQHKLLSVAFSQCPPDYQRDMQRAFARATNRDFFDFVNEECSR